MIFLIILSVLFGISTPIITQSIQGTPIIQDEYRVDIKQFKDPKIIGECNPIIIKVIWDEE